jgi:hypothetical protein
MQDKIDHYTAIQQVIANALWRYPYYDLADEASYRFELQQPEQITSYSLRTSSGATHAHIVSHHG